MARKRLTQMFPFLTPIRTWQKNIFYFLHMYFDNNIYAKKKSSLLAFEVCSSKTVMVNENSGQDIIYQKNKVENLKIASKTMNQVLIQPNETFSFCYLLKDSKKYGKYKEGLILIDGKVVARKSGGICHLSNLLYYLFLMTDLTITERHGHKIKSFPNPDKDSLEGVDATINSGWLDLKVKNNTDVTFQIIIDFDDTYMYGKILSNKSFDDSYSIINDNFKYIKRNNKIYESIAVIKCKHNKEGKIISKEKLYDEIVEVGYELPNNIKIEDQTNEEKS